MAARRDLQFATLDDITRDVENLHAAGYEKTGKWDLAQICNHCALWLKYPMDGFPPLPWFMKPVFWIVKRTVLPKFERQVREEKKMPTGMSTAPMTVFPAGEDEAKAVALLREQVERMKTFEGPWQPSPLRGVLPKDDQVNSALVHCAHHLSFLVPRNANQNG